MIEMFMKTSIVQKADLILDDYVASQYIVVLLVILVQILHPKEVFLWLFYLI